MGLRYIMQSSFCQRQPRGGTPCPRPGVAAKRSNPLSKEPWLCGRRRAKRSYSTVKVRRGDLVQGKAQWLCFAGAAVKRHPTSKARKCRVRSAIPIFSILSVTGTCESSDIGFIQHPWASLNSKGWIQTIANQGRKGIWKQEKQSKVRVAQEFGERNRRGLSPFLPLLLSFLGGPLAHPVRQTATVQHPQKS
ncbi:hypothetical protein MG293_001680 [Ovis ammon polii]|uniref:Uncharacterized protein n=1 Tax=Ovis ammon polii TaxID=230172 RepID=A0AAD4URY5_OVIAM|nr:hypothetical protein MG293_001680 [Ovis ammon polii]